MEDKLISIYHLSKNIAGINYKIMYHQLESLGLYPGQPIIMDIIKKNEGISQRGLATLSYKEPATITTMLNRMTNQGYIRKVSDEKDRRIVKLYLTEEGNLVYNKLYQMIKENVSNILFNCSEDEIKTIENILIKIKDNLEKQ